mgnify:CR=1 FL=1
MAQKSQKNKMSSGLLKINFKDFVNGLITAICVGVLPIVNTAVQSGDITSVDWNNVLKIALYAGGGYLLRKLLSTNATVVDGKEVGGKFLGAI